MKQIEKNKNFLVAKLYYNKKSQIFSKNEVIGFISENQYKQLDNSYPVKFHIWSGGRKPKKIWVNETTRRNHNLEINPEKAKNILLKAEKQKTGDYIVAKLPAKKTITWEDKIKRRARLGIILIKNKDKQKAKNSINNSDVLSTDIKGIFSSLNKNTEKEAMVLARIGQGDFRKKVLQHWGGECAVTGCSDVTLLRASHIKPWRFSTHEERLSELNGLPLTPNLDVLFDQGLITFDENGWIKLSKNLSNKTKIIMGVDKSTQIIKKTKLTAKTKEYLAYHRKKCFKF